MHRVAFTVSYSFRHLIVIEIKSKLHELSRILQELHGRLSKNVSRGEKGEALRIILDSSTIYILKFNYINQSTSAVDRSRSVTLS